MNNNPIIYGIIPCYNEENRLDKESFSLFIKNNSNFNFILVNDGSTDKTLDLLNELFKKYPKQVEVLNLNKNVGKAEAIRLGIQKTLSISNAKFCGFLDADLSTSLNEFKRLFDCFDVETQFAFGSRFQRLDSNIKRSLYRHYLGRVFATFASIILKLKIYDTQCGAKCFRKETAELIFNKPFKSQWIFDVELFFRLKEVYKNDSIQIVSKEVALNEWIEVKGSRIKFLDFLKVPFDLIRLYLHYSNK